MNTENKADKLNSQTKTVSNANALAYDYNSSPIQRKLTPPNLFFDIDKKEKEREEQTNKPFISQDSSDSNIQLKIAPTNPAKEENEEGESESKRNYDYDIPPTLPDSSQAMQSNSNQVLFERRQLDSDRLPNKVLQKMNAAFDSDFSNVKVHQNSKNASDLGALAYTQGSNIHFAKGAYQPESKGGQELIGHELAHTIQQSKGNVKPTNNVDGQAINENPALEKEADEMGKKAAHFSLPIQRKASFQPTSNVNNSVIQKKDNILSKENKVAYKASAGPKTWKDLKFWFSIGAEVKSDLHIDKGTKNETYNKLGNPKFSQVTKHESSNERKKATDKKTRKLSSGKRSGKFTTDLFTPFEVALEGELNDDNLAIGLSVNIKNDYVALKGKATILKYNDSSGEFEAFNAKIEGKSMKECFDANNITIEAGAKIDMKVEVDKLLLLKDLGKKLLKKVSKKQIEKFVEKIAKKEAAKLGIKLGSKGALLKVITKLNPALAVLSAFETGWSIGTLLRKYTVAGEIADKEMEALEDYRDHFQEAGTAGKVAWTIIYSKKIGWTMVKASVKGVVGAAGQAGEAVGESMYDHINEDDHAMDRTGGDYLEKFGFDRIAINEKIKYFKDIGGGFTSESEEERLVKIFEFSSPEDRKILLKNKHVWFVWKNKLDGNDRKKFKGLIDEAKGKSTLTLMDSKLEQHQLEEYINKTTDSIVDDPIYAISQLNNIDSKLKSLKKEAEAINNFSDPYGKFIRKLYHLKIRIESLTRLELIPPYVEFELQARNRHFNKLQYNTWEKIQKTPYELEDYNTYKSLNLQINTLLQLYASTVAQSAQNRTENYDLLLNIEDNLIESVETQISWCEKHLNQLEIPYDSTSLWLPDKPKSSSTNSKSKKDKSKNSTLKSKSEGSPNKSSGNDGDKNATHLNTNNESLAPFQLKSISKNQTTLSLPQSNFGSKTYSQEKQPNKSKRKQPFTL